MESGEEIIGADTMLSHAIGEHRLLKGMVCEAATRIERRSRQLHKISEHGKDWEHCISILCMEDREMLDYLRNDQPHRLADAISDNA